MNTGAKKLFLLALVVTAATLITWQATGGDAYTKFQVVKTVTVELDPNDPLVQAGFYGAGTTKDSTMTIDEFHLGLIPVPQGLFDKHTLSVASISGPPWLATIVLAVWAPRRRKRIAASGGADIAVA